MTWRIQHTRTFLKELSRLPQPYRTRVEAIALGAPNEVDVFIGSRLDKMRGYETYYKARIGSYRIGVQIDQDNKVVTFMRVRHRRDIYRYFP